LSKIAMKKPFESFSARLPPSNHSRTLECLGLISPWVIVVQI
jgi:hypothetical protein